MVIALQQYEGMILGTLRQVRAADDEGDGDSDTGDEVPLYVLICRIVMCRYLNR